MQGASVWRGCGFRCRRAAVAVHPVALMPGPKAATCTCHERPARRGFAKFVRLFSQSVFRKSPCFVKQNKAMPVDRVKGRPVFRRTYRAAGGLHSIRRHVAKIVRMSCEWEFRKMRLLSSTPGTLRPIFKKTTKMNASSVTTDPLSRLPECEAKGSIVDDELHIATGEGGSVVRAQYACGAATRRETLASGER